MTRFVLGFVIGAAASVAAVYFTAPRSGNAQREQLKSLWDGAKEAARTAEASTSAQMWADFRTRARQA
ncbi:MAG: YtxH domain-containing protein [Roseiflexaceae bacterium]|nr:YtxH domain-containing protein [Roseiflexaceae bacterium]